MKLKILAIAGLAVAVLTLAVATEAHAEKKKEYLTHIFRPLFKTFGQDSKTEIEIVSGYRKVEMNRGRTPGKEWIAQSGKFRFKLSIEDATKVDIETLIDRVQKLPPPYMRGCQVVSDEGENGIALYVTLGGAGGHGGKQYINLVAGAGPLIIAHEMGHSLEQVYKEKHPKILETWGQIAKEDGISVSGYGDSASSEDIAEFAMVYAVCLHGGPDALAELRELSPRRCGLWEEVLKEPEGKKEDGKDGEEPQTAP